MAQTIPVRGIGTKGVSVDVSPSELSLEFFDDCSNVYVHDLKVKNTPKIEEVLKGSHGEVQWFGYLYDETTREPRVVYVSRDNTGDDTIQIIEPGDLLLVDGSQMGGDASRGAGYTNISSQPYMRWNGFIQNSTAVLTNGADVPQYLSLDVPTFVDLPGWNPAWSTRVIQPFRGVWIAMHMVDSSAAIAKERQPTVIRWSSPVADYASPPLFWDELDTGNQPTGAGFNVLGESPGEVVTGRTLKDSFLIYKTDSVVRMDYTGAFDAPFSFRTLFEDTGAWGPNSVCSIRNEHFVVGTNDVYITDGFQKRSVITARVKDIFDKLVFSSTKAHDVICTPHYGNEEVYVLIRTKNAGGSYETKVLTYNYTQDQWFFRSIEGGSNVTFAGMGAASLQAPVVFDRWDEADTMSWDQGTESVEDQWNNFTDVLSISYLMFAIDNKFYTYGAYRNAISGEDCYIRKSDMDFNQLAGTYSDRIKRVLRLYPIMDPESKGHLIFTLWGHDRPGQVVPESYKKQYLFDCSSDHKIDVSVSGRYVTMEIRTDSNLVANWLDYDFQNNPSIPLVQPVNLVSLAGIDLDLVANQRK